MELTWSNDFCLACDNQTSGGVYCSSTCRLADQQATSTSSSAQTTPSSSSFPKSTRTFPNLGPAIDFDTYRSSSSSSSAQGNPTASKVLPRYYNANKFVSLGDSQSPAKSSGSSSPHRPQLSEKVHMQLRDYTNGFDTKRNRGRGWSS